MRILLLWDGSLVTLHILVFHILHIKFVVKDLVNITQSFIALKLIKIFWLVFIVKQFIWHKNNIFGCSSEQLLFLHIFYVIWYKISEEKFEKYLKTEKNQQNVFPSYIISSETFVVGGIDNSHLFWFCFYKWTLSLLYSCLWKIINI